MLIGSFVKLLVAEAKPESQLNPGEENADKEPTEEKKV